MLDPISAFRVAAASWRFGWPARSTALAVLAVAVAGHLSIMGFWWRAVNRTLPFDAPDRIVRVSLFGDSARPRLVHEETAFLSHATTLVGVWHTASLPTHLVGGEFPIPVTALLVGEDLLADLGVAPSLGRLFVPSEHTPPPSVHAPWVGGVGQPVVVVSHDFWRSRLGATTDLATTTLDLTLGSETETEAVRTRVIGVMPDGFTFPDDETDLWYPLAPPRSESDFHAAVRDNPALDGAGFTLRSGPVGVAWGRLAAGRTLAEAREELTALLERRRESASLVEYRREPVSVIVTPLRDALVEPVARSLRLLAAGAMVLLAVATLSAIGLLFSTHLADLKSRRVRHSVGAGAGDELAVSVARVLLGAVPLAVVALFLANWFGSVLYRFGAGIYGPQTSSWALPTVVYALATGVLVCLIAEAPAFVSLISFGGRDFASRRGARMRFAAFVAGVGASTLMLGSVAGLIASAARLLRGADSYASDLVLVDLGQRPGYPATFGDPDREEQLRRRVEALAEVERAAFAAVLPDHPSDRFHRIYDDDGSSWRFDLRHVSPGFFETVGLSVVEGRGFIPDDLDEVIPPLVVDEVFARRYGLDSMGTVIHRRCRGCSGLVIGRSRSMSSFPGGTTTPTMYSIDAVSASHFDHPRSRFLMLVRPSGGRTDSVGAVAGALRGAVPGAEVLRVRTAGEMRRELLGEGVALSAALAVLAAAAFFLSLGNCAGQVAEEQRRRRREQAIRAAVGAPPAQLAWEAGRRSAAGALAGVLAGGVGVYFLHRGLVARFNWAAAPMAEQLLAPAALFVFALGVVWSVAWRARPQDPMENLRPQD